MYRTEMIAENAGRLGYEINRVLLGLHLLWWFFVEQGMAHVFGIVAILASLVLAYFCETLRLLGSGHAEKLAAGACVATGLSAFFWIYEVL